MVFVDSDKDEWKNDGKSYKRVLPDGVELNVKTDNGVWRWTLYQKRRPIESGPAKSVNEAMTAVKEAAKRRL